MKLMVPRVSVFAALLFGLVASPAFAAVPAPASATEGTAEGEELDLEALFNTQVEVATKKAQSLSEAPAVVTVITAEDIRERGYTSVADALRAVPGFYLVDDHLLPSLGVRGVPSGQRAWSRIVKVMLDGTPIPYLPEATNFLGPELIPLGLVKRIEIIRGPGSALYGADAFLGVINVVTKRGEDMTGANASVWAGGRPGHGRAQASVAAGFPLPKIEGEVVAGALAGIDDRSGYGVPDASPFATRFANQVSQNDLAWPGSFFGRVGNLATPLGALAVEGAYQHVSAGGEFQDFHPFSQNSRITLENRLLHAALRGQPLDKLSANVSVGYASGAPGADDRLSTGNPNYTIRRDMGSDGLNAAAEASYAFDQRNSLTAGADFARTNHRLPTYYDVFTAASGRAGEQTQDGPAGEARTFDNLGVYSQGILYVLEDTALTLGVRMDAHNVYGNVFNSRAGLVSPLLPNLSGKLLYGSSFKAPSPQQLFGKPLVFGDILGNPDLKPEQAQTVEAALLWAPLRQLDLVANAYYSHVTDKIGFVAQGGNSRAVNQSQLDSVGLEGEAKWRWRFLHGSVNTSVQTTASLDQDTAGASVPGRPEAYPTYMLNAGVGAPLGFVPLGAYLESRLVGAVPATQGNFATNGLVDYALPPVLLLDFTLSSKEWTLGDGALSASVKLANILDSADAQPGFGGIDYPGAGRTLLLRLDYAW
ncbi:MAG: TonB-dependent receptor [Cyanobacteria bacterium RYN_339]|nr:TonB-dependent receptor [Cyanobacteria bacterium RYN_339]